MQDRASRFSVAPFRGQPLDLWQGTILSGSDRSRPNRLVVSADCDLLNDKGSGEFFCLDVFSTNAFVSEVVLPETTDDLLSVLTEEARDIATTRNSAFSAIAGPILQQWLLGGDLTRWSKDLPKVHGNDLDYLVELAKCATRLTSSRAEPCKSPANEESVTSLLLTCANQQLKAKVEQANKKLRKVIAGRLQSSRSDLYVFPPMPGSSEKGHFIPFKSLGLMKRSQVCGSRVDLLERPDGCIPMAVCRPVLMHSLLQKLTLYFTRIGLTDQFKTEQESVIKAIMEKIT